MNSQDIRDVSFGRVFRGYSIDEVDAFLERVERQMIEDGKTRNALAAKNTELAEAVSKLQEKLQQYQQEEEILKSALLNAQRMGESIIQEARQKAESVLRESVIREENVARAAKAELEESRREYAELQNEIAHFKATVLGLYQQHIETLSKLPVNEIPERDIQAAAEEAPAAEAEPVESASDSFWEQDEEDLKN